MRAFADLTERDLLALGISSEEKDGRVYAAFSQRLRDEYPDNARMFSDMTAEENERRCRLIDTFTERFGPHIPFVQRKDLRGWVRRKPGWQVRAMGIEGDGHARGCAGARHRHPHRQRTRRMARCSP